MSGQATENPIVSKANEGFGGAKARAGIYSEHA